MSDQKPNQKILIIISYFLSVVAVSMFVFTTFLAVLANCKRKEYIGLVLQRFVHCYPQYFHLLLS
jgi:hypothetical protein